MPDTAWVAGRRDLRGGVAAVVADQVDARDAEFLSAGALRANARSSILPRMLPSPKPLVWMGSSKQDLRAFPEEVRHVMGYALYLAQVGGKHLDAKPLRGFGGAGVLEVVDDFDGDTYRAVYTVKLRGVVYALHAFQKKSKRGIKTAPHDLELVRRRLRQAEEVHDRSAAGERGEGDEEED